MTIGTTGPTRQGPSAGASGSIGRFVARRFAALVLLSLGITFVAFLLTSVVPGDPAGAALGPIESTNPAAVSAWKAKYGLDKPLYQRYLIYLDNLVHGDLGVSQQTGDPVLSDLASAIPATVELGIASLLLSVPLGILLGILAALRKDSLADHFVRLLCISGVSIPLFWIALIAVFVFYYKLGWLPEGGQLGITTLPPPRVTGMVAADSLFAGWFRTFGDAVDHLILPALVLATYNFGYIGRYTRAAVLEVIHHDYVRAARAKGLPQRTLVFRYILRAALPSMIQILGFAFAAVLTGAVLVEAVFSWPGLGQYAYKSSISLDLPAIMGVCLFVSVVYIVTNFVVDVLYAVIDPRIRLA